ncbi:hypothetical protein J7E68_12955 [Microbacterium sp. ISL-103]|uniref:hypothetical protein n=1 Tax=Microbacterium sp. ISL-103 TaxID=2819156 RepID=UPI001BEC273A|nr:hypothetical protein [Microbacterium sp. ISL-103]MBT2475454.1 hypothetical protein [Microbacterium sp. ISL-103]
MRSPIPAAASVLLATSLLLTGCSLSTPGESTPTEQSTESEAPEQGSPSLDAEPAAGETISGDGYTYVVPEGWAVPEQSVAGFDPDTLAANLQDTDGFADNVNVLKSPAGVVTPDVVESAGVKELESVGATDITVNDRVTIAGSESAHLSAALSSEGTDYGVEQYYVSTDDQTYIVTFSFSDSVSAADRVGVAESILVTWTWV